MFNMPHFSLKEDIGKKEVKLEEAYERKLQPRKPKAVEQLLRKPKNSVLDRVNKRREKKARKDEKRRIRTERKKKRAALLDKTANKSLI